MQTGSREGDAWRGRAWLYKAFFPAASAHLHSFGFRLFLGLLLLNLVMVALAVWSLYQSRSRYEEAITVGAQNLARLVEHDVSVSIRSIDLILQAAVEEVGLGDANHQPAAPRLNRWIEQQRFIQPDLDGLRVSDVHGFLTHGTGVSPSSKLSIKDRDYFILLRSGASNGMVIARPVQGLISKKWVLNLARPLRGADGKFAGVVVGSIPLERFTHLFAGLAIGQRGTVNLFDNERRIVARHSAMQAPGSGVGMQFGSPQMLALLNSGSLEGTYKAVSTVDGVERIFAHRKILGAPLNVSVGMATSEYLQPWYDELTKSVIAVLVFIMVSAVLSWLIMRAWSSQATMTGKLRTINAVLEGERYLSQTIIQSSPLAIYTRDRQGIVTAWNPAAEKLFGWQSEQIVGKTLLSVPVGRERESGEFRDRVLAGENIINLEVQRQKQDGTLFDLNTTLAPLRDASGEVTGYLAIADDITARKAAEAQIEFLAYRDVLTGLPNRLLLQDRFGQAMAHAERSHSKAALVFLDLDNFKIINDSLGHAVGDALLQEIAMRLGACVRETDTISRQGGDEFLIVLSDLGGTEAIQPVLLKIRENLQAPFLVDGHELTTSASIGVALYPDDGRDFETLLKKADTAMYRAKDAGRNHYRFFDEQMNVEAVEHLHFKSGLRRALAQDEFELHYQPQFELASGRVIGVEALLRWRHPEDGLISPARFIPVAEDSGLIVPIGEWVIQEACRQAVVWRAAGLPPLIMAVNLSAVQFRRGDVEQTIARTLQATGFDPQLLDLELTESILIQDTESVLGSVRQLKRLGVKLSIDDFGTGYSSLSYLKRFDVDKLKIDQSFIRDLATDPDDAAIVRAIVQMAASLGLRTIAEGVEDAATLALLREFACDEAQGYHFARPMEAQAFASFMARIAGA